MYEKFFEITNIDEILKSLEKNKKSILFYGAGQLAAEMFASYDISNLNVLGISDKKFEESETNTFCKLNTYKPSELVSLDFDILFLSVYQGEYVEKIISDTSFYKALKKRKGRVIKLQRPILEKITGKESNEKCIICSHNRLKSYYGIIAPFLKNFMFDDKHMCTELLSCPKCKFSYFKLRPTEEDVNRYYSRYRNKEYNETRLEYEPQYINVMQEIKNMKPRKFAFQRDLQIINKDLSKFEKVLDYGGYGDFFEDILPNSKKYIYDKSDIQLQNNIESLNSLDDCDNTFDFIMSTQVLEHVSYPDKMVKEIYEKLKPNGYIYISVPNENGQDGDCGFWNRLKRIKQPFVMHEHINIFKPKTLELLLKNCGFKVLKCKAEKIAKNSGYKRYNYIIAQK